MKKSLGRTLIFGAIVGALFISAFVCYGVGRNLKDNYSAANVEKLTQEGKLKDADDAEKPAIQEKIDKLAAQMKTYDNSYHGFAGAAYALTIASLASFGICLAISDKIKEKEEEEAAKS